MVIYESNMQKVTKGVQYCRASDCVEYVIQSRFHFKKKSISSIFKEYYLKKNAQVGMVELCHLFNETKFSAHACRVTRVTCLEYCLFINIHISKSCLYFEEKKSRRKTG